MNRCRILDCVGLHCTKGDIHHYGPAAALRVVQLRHAPAVLAYKAFELRLR
jgi:hypothetical protein